MNFIKINETSIPYQKAFLKRWKQLKNGSLSRCYFNPKDEYIEVVLRQDGSFTKTIWRFDSLVKSITRKLYNYGNVLEVYKVSTDIDKKTWRFCNNLVSMDYLGSKKETLLPEQKRLKDLIPKLFN